MDYKRELELILQYAKSEYKILSKALHSSPKGEVQARMEGDYLKINRVYKDEQGWKKRGIKKRPDLIKSLSRKKYLIEKTERLNVFITTTEKTLLAVPSLDEDEIFKSIQQENEFLPTKYWARSDVHQARPVFDASVPMRVFKPVLSEEEIKAFSDEPYRANSFALNEKKQRNTEGIAFRSKSEMSIYELYIKHGCSVHYDELMQFGSYQKSPDFVAVRPDGKVILHEHCGLVENEEYMKRHYAKIELYKSFGIAPWDNLIVSYEKPGGGIDLKLVEAQIQAFLRN